MRKENGTVMKIEAIDLLSTAFYKVVVIEIGVMGSEIIDERNFPSEETAESFREEHELNGGNVCYLVVRVEK